MIRSKTRNICTTLKSTDCKESAAHSKEGRVSKATTIGEELGFIASSEESLPQRGMLQEIDLPFEKEDIDQQCTERPSSRQTITHSNQLILFRDDRIVEEENYYSLNANHGVKHAID